MARKIPRPTHLNLSPPQVGVPRKTADRRGTAGLLLAGVVLLCLLPLGAAIEPLPDEFWVQSRNEEYCAHLKTRGSGDFNKEYLLTVNRVV